MSTNRTTEVTRRESYSAASLTLEARQRLVLDVLGESEMTASEIAGVLVVAGLLQNYDRNVVAPRLTELKARGIVETCGTRPSTRSGRLEAVWRKVQQSKETKEETR